MVNKHVEVTRVGREISVVVTVSGAVVDSAVFDTRSDAIDWVYENHFDSTSLRADTTRDYNTPFQECGLGKEILSQ